MDILNLSFFANRFLCKEEELSWCIAENNGELIPAIKIAKVPIFINPLKDRWEITQHLNNKIELFDAELSKNENGYTLSSKIGTIEISNEQLSHVYCRKFITANDVEGAKICAGLI